MQLDKFSLVASVIVDAKLVDDSLVASKMMDAYLVAA